MKYTLSEKKVLKKLGTTDNGQDAIDMAAEHLPDVVLMDIKLKGNMSGIEASEIISELGIAVKDPFGRNHRPDFPFS